MADWPEFFDETSTPDPLPEPKHCYDHLPPPEALVTHIDGPHSCFWVPEGSLARFFVRHRLAFELVCGADFLCKLMCRAALGDLWGVPWAPAI